MLKQRTQKAVLKAIAGVLRVVPRANTELESKFVNNVARKIQASVWVSLLKSNLLYGRRCHYGQFCKSWYCLVAVKHAIVVLGCCEGS